MNPIRSIVFTAALCQAIACGTPSEPCKQLVVTTYPDADADGYGETDNPEETCGTPVGRTQSPGDCDDTRTTINIGGIEVCDGLDNDCDDLIDDGLVELDWFPDEDGDGFGVDGTVVSACGEVPGYADNILDCDDGDAANSPNGNEVCDGVDNDCDGDIDMDDESLDPNSLLVFFRDADGDGFGNPNAFNEACVGSASMVDNGDDCDDTRGSANPLADEQCSGRDDDCDNLIDEADPSLDPALLSTFYADSDGDGFGDPLVPLQMCFASGSAQANDDDCDDTDPNLGAAPVWYFDGDGDGFGAGLPAPLSCTSPGPDYVNDDGLDCDDGDPNIFPGAPENEGDGIDSNCNGIDGDSTHNTEPFIPTNVDGQFCGGGADVSWAHMGNLTFDACQDLANRTGTQWYAGISSANLVGWIGDQDPNNAVITSSNVWGTEVIVPRTAVNPCVLGQFEHRTAATVNPVEQIYVDSQLRTWHYWDLIDQTHSQAISFADNRGARIINPNSVGQTGQRRMTAPTHWCHAGAEFNGTSSCNTDNICSFMVGYWE